MKLPAPRQIELYADLCYHHIVVETDESDEHLFKHGITVTCPICEKLRRVTLRHVERRCKRCGCFLSQNTDFKDVECGPCRRAIAERARRMEAQRQITR